MLALDSALASIVVAGFNGQVRTLPLNAASVRQHIDSQRNF
jgi:hypothetical protein